MPQRGALPVLSRALSDACGLRLSVRPCTFANGFPLPSIGGTGLVQALSCFLEGTQYLCSCRPHAVLMLQRHARLRRQQTAHRAANRRAPVGPPFLIPHL